MPDTGSGWFKRAASRSEVKQPRPRRSGIMALEPRIMYDAAAAATVGAAAHHQDGANDHATIAAAEKQAARVTTNSGAESASAAAQPKTLAQAPNVQTPSSGNASSDARHGHDDRAVAEPMPLVKTWVKDPTEIVFIDPRAPDYQLLASGVKPGIEVVVLDPNSDGVQQIANFLNRHPDPNLATIDIVAHGHDGMLFLGSSVLDNDTVGQYRAQLKTIGAALRPGGDLMLYGCDVAAHPSGMILLAQIVDTTGVNVAAATGPVGSAAQGGSWSLQATSGAIHSTAPFTAATLAAYPDLLNVDLYGIINDGGAGSGIVFGTDKSGTGLGSASGVTRPTPTFSVGNPQQIQLDVKDGLYFVLLESNNNNQGNTIQEYSLSSALNGTPQLLNTIYADGTPGNQINAFHVDVADNVIFFNYLVNAYAAGPYSDHVEAITFSGSHFAGTVAGGTATVHDISGALNQTVLAGMVVDPVHQAAYFYQTHTTTTTVGSGGQTQFGNPMTKNGAIAPLSKQHLATLISKDQLFKATWSGNNTNPVGFSLTQLPIAPQDSTLLSNNFPTSLGKIAGLALDSTAQVLYFDTDSINGGSSGIFSYALSGNATGTYGTVWTQTTAVSGALTEMVIDPGTQKYYVSVANKIYNGSLSGGAPAVFITIDNTADPGLVAKGLAVVHDQPVVTAGATATFHGGDPTATLDPALTIANTSTLVSATVSIASFITGDTLTINGATSGTINNGANGSITYSFSGSTLTLSGNDTVADYTAALDAVKYSFIPGNGDPTGGGSHTSRTINWVVNDGTLSSATATSTLNVVHVAPTVTAGATVTFNGGGSAVTLDGGLTVADVDSGGNLSSATVTIAASISGDMLNFTNQHNITGSYNAIAGVLTLTGADTLADYQAALDSITYSFSPTGGDPTGGGSHTSRTIQWVVNDGVASSALATSTLNTVHVAPTVTPSGTAATFVSGGSAVALDGALMVRDVDSGGNLTGATVTIAAPVSGDTLNFINQHNITGSYNLSTGVLTLTGTDTLANYQTALQSITFSSSSTTAGSRTINWTVNDGVASSVVATSTVNEVVGPTVTAGAIVTFHGGDSTATLDSGLTLIDSASPTISSATVTIMSGLLNTVSAFDVLSFNNGSNTEFFAGDNATISATYHNGQLILSGIASVADYQVALRQVQYSFSPINGDPTAGAASDTIRNISWVVNDGSRTNTPAATSTLNVVHVAPTVSAGQTATFTGGGAAVTLGNSLTVSDVDSGGKLTGATVSILGFISGDTLTINGTISGTINHGANGTISYSFSGSILTLSGTDTVQNYTAALDAVKYSFSPANGDPTGGGSQTSRAISWVVNDGAVTNGSSGAALSQLNTVHVAPTITPSGATATFTGGGAAVALDGALTVSDLDSGGNLTGANVQITTGFIGGADMLNFTNQNGITGSYNAATGLLTLTGTTTLANYQTALDSITYSFSPTNGDPTNGGGDTSRTIGWIANDGMSSSTTATSTLNVVHAAPTVTAGQIATFTGGGSAVTLDSMLTVGDVDSNGKLTGARVTISSGFLPGDTLTINGTASGSINGAGGTISYSFLGSTLTLSGTDTVTDYTAALRSITYSFRPTNGDPTNGGGDTARTISWTVNDGSTSNGTNTPAATSTLNVVHVAPVLVAGSPSVTFVGGSASPVTLDSTLTVSDVDSGGNLTGATVRISSGLVNNARDLDVLSFNNGTNTEFFAGDSATITATYSNGQLVLRGTASVADYQTALRQVQYSFQSNVISGFPNIGDPTNGGGNTARTISWQVSDGASSSASVDTALSVTHTPPQLIAGGLVTYTQGAAPLVAVSTATVTDPNSDNLLSSVTVAITSGFRQGDVLDAVTTGLNVRASYDATRGVLTLSGLDTLADYQRVLDSVTFSSVSANPSNFGTDLSRTLTWTANDTVSSSASQTSTVQLVPVNDTPVVTAGAAASFAQGGAPVILDSGLTISDNDQHNLTSATVSITGGFLAGDTLAFNSGATTVYSDGGAIVSSYNSSTGVLTLTGTSASIADFRSALSSVTFSNAGSNPTNFGTDLTRTISWTVNDGAANPPFQGAPGSDQSVAVTSTVNIVTINDTPVVNGVTGTSVTSTQNGGPVALAANAITITDHDQTNMAGATVQITGGLLAGDVLNFTDQNGIQGTYDEATGKLTLTGSSSIANYQAALASITFTNTGINPSNFGTDLARTISWTVVDGAVNPPFSNAPGSDRSAVVTSRVDIHAVPTVVAGADAAFNAGIGNTVVLDPTVAVYDGTNLTGATVKIAAGFVSGGTLAANTTGTSIHTSYDQLHGILTLSGNDTIQNYQKVLASVSFGGSQLQSGPMTIAWQVTDQNGLTSKPGTSTLDITAIIDGPHLFADSRAMTPPQNATPASLVSDSASSDPLVPPSSGEDFDTEDSRFGYYVVHTDAELTTASDATVQIKLALAALEAPLGGDVTHVAARQSNADPLPDWLKFDPDTGTFAGLPPDNAVASIEPDQSLDSNILTGSLPPKPDRGTGPAPNKPAAPKTISVEVLVRDSKGNIAVTIFTIDLRPRNAGRQGWHLDGDAQSYGTERHASVPTMSPQLAMIEAAVHDVTRPIELSALRGMPIRHGDSISVGPGETAPAGRAGLTEQLASIGWRSMAAQRDALLASLRQSR